MPNTKPIPYVLRHRRDWRRLWLRCACGRCWRSCPDRGRSLLVHRAVPPPDLPPQLAFPDVGPDVPLAPSVGRRAPNQGPAWRTPIVPDRARAARRGSARTGRGAGVGSGGPGARAAEVKW